MRIVGVELVQSIAQAILVLPVRQSPQLLALRVSATEALRDSRQCAQLCVMVVQQFNSKELPEEVSQELVDKAHVGLQMYSEWVTASVTSQGDGFSDPNERMAHIQLSGICRAVEYLPELSGIAALITDDKEPRAEAVRRSLRRMSYALMEALSIVDELGVSSHERFYADMLQLGYDIVSLVDIEGVHLERLPELALRCEVWMSEKKAGKLFGYRVPKRTA